MARSQNSCCQKKNISRDLVRFSVEGWIVVTYAYVVVDIALWLNSKKKESTKASAQVVEMTQLDGH